MMQIQVPRPRVKNTLGAREYFGNLDAQGPQIGANPLSMHPRDSRSCGHTGRFHDSRN